MQRGKWGFRFGLRTLLATVTVVCLVLGLLVQDAYRYQQRKQHAKAMIQSLRGQVVHFGSSREPSDGDNFLTRRIGLSEPHEDLWQVDLAGTAVTPSDLELLANCDWIRRLSLARTGITNADLKRVGRLTKLRELNLAETKVDDTGLRNLHPLSRLVKLDATATNITDAGLRELDRHRSPGSLADAVAIERVARFRKSVGCSPTERLYADALPDEGGNSMIFVPDGACSVYASGDVTLDAALVAELKSLRRVQEATFRLRDQQAPLTELLRQWNELKLLMVRNVRLTEADFDAMAQLPHLRQLCLEGEPQFPSKTDASAIAPEMLPELEVVRHASKLKSLERLELSFNSHVLEESVDEAARAVERQRISQIIESLQSLPNLKVLRLSGSAFDDSNVGQLASFPKLRMVVVDSTYVSAAAMRALRNARPDCGVFRNPALIEGLNVDSPAYEPFLKSVEKIPGKRRADEDRDDQ